MRGYFALTAVLTMVLGVAWTVFPNAGLASLGMPADAATAYMARRYGAQFFGYAVMLWASRAVEEPAARRAILGGSAVVTSVLAVVSLVGVVSGVVNQAGWGVFAVEVLLAIGFTRLAIAEHGASRR